MLEFKGFSKSYDGNKKAVDSLSLKIEGGDIYGFIGHNGAGKTTAIKCACGILDFSDGEIFIDGKNIKSNPIEVKSLTAYIPDNPDLYEQMSGIGYLNFIGDIYKVEPSKKASLIEKYASMFEIKPYLANKISSYSHGMKQKLAIISALIHSPRLFVLDEPFVGLDPKASYTLKSILKEMCDDGAAVFFSTHVLEVAEKLCNKIAIIKDGKLISSGETAKVIGDSSLESVFLDITGVKENTENA